MKIKFLIIVVLCVKVMSVGSINDLNSNIDDIWIAQPAALLYDQRGNGYCKNRLNEDEKSSLSQRVFVRSKADSNTPNISFGQNFLVPERALVSNGFSQLNYGVSVTVGGIFGAIFQYRNANTYKEEVWQSCISEFIVGGLFGLTILGITDALSNIHYSNDIMHEKVLGSIDRRKSVDNLEVVKMPKVINGHLEMRYIDTATGYMHTYFSSGTLVGDNKVITAAHNVYNHGFDPQDLPFYGKKSYAQEVLFFPGYTGNKNTKLVAKAVLYEMNPNYTSATTSKNALQHDIAMLTLDKNFGTTLGQARIIALDDEKKPNVTISGYPAEPGKGQQMYSMTGPILENKQNMTFYDVDTSGGQSGSGIIHTTQSTSSTATATATSSKTQYLCVGTHTSGTHITSTGQVSNGGTRITDNNVKLIKQWLKN